MPKQASTSASNCGWRTHTRYLEMHTRKRREMVHITDEVERIVRESGVDDGLCFVSPMHITAAIYVNDNESGLIHDIGEWLEQLAPAKPGYRHHQTGEDKCRRPSESSAASPRDHAARYQRPSRPRHLAADFLCRVRRPAYQAHHRKGARGGCGVQQVTVNERFPADGHKVACAPADKWSSNKRFPSQDARAGHA